MSINVPIAADVAAKWASVTPGRQAYYAANAAAAGNIWQANTVAAAAAFKNAISAGNIQAMYTGGVKKAGAAKYTRKINDVGASRFSSGVTAAQPDMQAGIAPILQTIAGLTLPARQPRGSAANLQRVQVVADALNKTRLAQAAATS
jgi:hypothetical protein